MSEGKAIVNGIDIWYETFGRPADPTVLLIRGAGEQGTAWRPEFCEGLVAGGRHVIRFDNRDVGLSEWFADDEPYTLYDMADDTVGLLDALEIDRAHLVGISMGGMIGQILAIHHPERVLTLTSMLSSPCSLSDPSFEPPDPHVMEVIEHLLGETPESREEKIEQRLGLSRALAGTRYPFDEEWWRSQAAEGVDRAWRPFDRSHVVGWPRQRQSPEPSSLRLRASATSFRRAVGMKSSVPSLTTRAECRVRGDRGDSKC